MIFAPHPPRTRQLTTFGWTLSTPLVLFLFMHMIAAPPSLHAQQTRGSATVAATPEPKSVRLSKIEFTGLERNSREHATAAAGLQLGEPITVEAVDAAAERLLSTGLFKKLSYSFVTSREGATVTFQVEESKSYVPVVFDNFVWFKEAELLSAIRREVPAFDGNAPEEGGRIDDIKKALEGLLRVRGIAGEVEYTVGADPSGGNREHVFSVRGAQLPICTLVFPRAAAIKESELVKASQPLILNTYSRQYVQGFVHTHLIPLYRQRGLLRAGFLSPVAKLEDGPNEECKGGVAVSVPVEEGPIYTWERAEWNGHTALSYEELNAALRMRPKEIADLTKIEKGIKNVEDTYRRQGYVAAKITAAPVYDDAQRRVVYRFQINEGEQHRLGSIAVTGLEDAEAERIKAQWRLAPGDVFDALYPAQFVKQLLATGKYGTDSEKVDYAVRTDRAKPIVYVTINFK